MALAIAMLTQTVLIQTRMVLLLIVTVN